MCIRPFPLATPQEREEKGGRTRTQLLCPRRESAGPRQPGAQVKDDQALCGSGSYRRANTAGDPRAVTNQKLSWGSTCAQSGGLGRGLQRNTWPFRPVVPYGQTECPLGRQAWLSNRGERPRKCLVNCRVQGPEPAAAVPRRAGRVLTFPASAHTRLQGLELHDHLLFASFRL